jgi:outer membrane protein OmpA-like peptidoglycan-associated protein
LLDNVAAVLTSHSQLKIQVEGHTDNQGDDRYNKKLSQRRAEAVVAYLGKKGIAGARLVAKGFGEDKPIADNNTEEGRAQNRRVVFTILSGGDNVKTRVQGAGDDTK